MFFVIWFFLGSVSVAIRVVTVTTLMKQDYKIKTFLEDVAVGLILGPVALLTSASETLTYLIKDNFVIFKARKD